MGKAITHRLLIMPNLVHIPYTLSLTNAIRKGKSECTQIMQMLKLSTHSHPFCPCGPNQKRPWPARHPHCGQEGPSQDPGTADPKYGP